MNNNMLKVGGAPIKTPSALTWGLKDNSASDAGRVQDANDTMYKNRTSQKRTLALSWNAPTPAEAAAILQAVNPEYIMVTYFDVMAGVEQTREFYVGDRSAMFKIWTTTNKRYSQIAFDLIER